MQIIEICSTPNYWHFIFLNFLSQFKPDRKWLYPFQWFKFSLSHARWLFLSNSSEGAPNETKNHTPLQVKWSVPNDIIGSAKGSQISEKYWGEVGKGKRIDVYLEVRKRRGHIFFEWNKCLWTELLLRVADVNHS
jgi:hypothetical protein